MQGTRLLAQVALAYLVVSGTFCFPGITSSTVSPGLVSKYPGRAPKGALSCGVRLVVHLMRVACVRSCLGVFVGSPTCARYLSILYSDTLSARDMGAPRPMGSLTARVLGDGGSAPPRVSTLPSSFVSRLGSRIRSLTGSSQQSPTPWLRLAPSATPRRFPIQTKGMSTLLTRLFGVHDRTTLIRNHMLSPTLSGHTPQWLPNYSVLMVEGCGLAFTLLLVHVHQFNWLAPGR